MSKIFLNEDELDTKINDFLTRKNRIYRKEKAAHGNRQVRMDVMRDNAVVAM